MQSSQEVQPAGDALLILFILIDKGKSPVYYVCEQDGSSLYITSFMWNARAGPASSICVHSESPEAPGWTNQVLFLLYRKVRLVFGGIARAFLKTGR